MVSQRQDTAVVLAWTGSAFLVAMAILVSGFAVVTLGLLLVMGFVVALPVMGIVAAGLGVRALAKQRARERAIAGAKPIPVHVRLVEMTGQCVGGHNYFVGEEFTFQGERTVTPRMCGPALHGLMPYIQKLRTGENGHEARIQCPKSGSVLVFELSPEVQRAA